MQSSRGLRMLAPMTTTLLAPQFDAELISRYERNGPRYTSYPTAPQFQPAFDARALRGVIALSNEEPIPRPLSLYVHVPFCQSPCFYCGCSRVITRDIGKADVFLQHVEQEIACVGPLFDRDRQVQQLHLGGGTPNFLDLKRMARLLHGLRQHFNFAPDGQGELGIEVDPRFIDAAYVQGLATLGFNRLSAGIQDFNPAVQQAVNRVQSVPQTRSVLDTARDAGFASISVDLIYGLPRQTLQGFEQTLDEVLQLGPDRIAVYGYAHMPRLFKAQSQIDADELPTPALRLALFGLALERLTANGYLYVGMDHFARAGDSLIQAQRNGTLQRNFQGYSTAADCDIIGLGPTAISRIGDSYSQNIHNLPGYYAATASQGLAVARGLSLSDDDILRREIINTLMCHARLDKSAIAERYGIDFDRYFAQALLRLQALANDELVQLNRSSIDVTPKGRLLLRHVAMCFDAYLGAEPQAKTYSQTI